MHEPVDIASHPSAAEPAESPVPTSRPRSTNGELIAARLLVLRGLARLLEDEPA